MVSSILRRISEKAAANVRGVMDPAKKFPLRGLIVPAKNSLVRGSSPWLMLSPAFEGNDNNVMVFNFYSFAEKPVQKVFRERVGILVNDLDDTKFVSSCHGWLALFNKRNLDLFLFNPISGRQIKLPPIEPLNIDAEKIRSVTKLITSCSPEEEDCLIMLSFGNYRRLAFCSPTSTEWTRIGSRHRKRHFHIPLRKSFDDFVYSSTQKRLYCITNYTFFEAWDFQDTGSPKILEMDPRPKYDKYYPQHEFCGYHVFLVVAEESGDLLWVKRYIVNNMEIDGSYSQPVVSVRNKLPYKTVGFDVYKYDPEKGGSLVYMDGSLDGLALFIGNNHSFAISASEFPELQPNSIYFTDAHQEFLEETMVRYVIPEKKPFGGHDIGIFNYENKSFALTCYYPCDRQSIKRIMPAPMWFTPT